MQINIWHALRGGGRSKQSILTQDEFSRGKKSVVTIRNVTLIENINIVELVLNNNKNFCSNNTFVLNVILFFVLSKILFNELLAMFCLYSK